MILLILLLISFTYVIILCTRVFGGRYMSFPIADFFGKRKITRILDKILLYLSLLLQAYFWLFSDVI